MIFEEDLDIDFLDSSKQDFSISMQKFFKDIKSFIPEIYRENRESSPFNIFKFFYIFSIGILVGLIIYYFPYFIFIHSIINSNGNHSSFFDFSFCSYYAIVIIQNLILFIDSRYWNISFIFSFVYYFKFKLDFSLAF